ncbi:hypothetical protein MUK42_12953 [Musa troglodytarum]|uniref:F-box domain-containing protein n=2 Tax=Musa troglodytarum TaxID=320322 RepID=A0A9E7I3D2_9LILI|nr:hypothetical protein MUK42_12953 [Musa troglodytarum]
MAPPLTGEGEEESCWSRLPTDEMEMILKRLTLVDQTRVAAVCKSWHAAVSFLQAPSPPPWLVVSRGLSGPRSWGLCTAFAGRRSLGLEIPKELQRQWCCGSSKGWLLFSRTTAEIFLGYQASLLNPITGVMVHFGPCVNYVVKGIISASPLTAGFIYASLGYNLADAYKCVTVYRPWQLTYEELEVDDPMDILFHHGRLYILTGSVEIVVYMFEPHPMVSSIIPIPSLVGEDERRRRWRNGWLVGSNDDVFIVFYTTKLRSELQQLKVFKVKKGLRHRHRVVEVNGLGGRTFFIGGFSEGLSASMTKSSSKSELIKPDCIYYRKHVEDDLEGYCMQTGRSFRVAGLDVAGDLLSWFTPDTEDQSSLMEVTPTNGFSRSRSLLLTIIIISVCIMLGYIFGRVSILRFFKLVN